MSVSEHSQSTKECNAEAQALYGRFRFRAERTLWNGGRQLWLEKDLGTTLRT